MILHDSLMLGLYGYLSQKHSAVFECLQLLQQCLHFCVYVCVCVGGWLQVPVHECLYVCMCGVEGRQQQTMEA